MDGVVRLAEAQDVLIVIEQLIFTEVCSMIFIDLIISNLDNFVSIVYVPINEIIKIGFKPPNNFSIRHFNMIEDSLGCEIK